MNIFTMLREMLDDFMIDIKLEWEYTVLHRWWSFKNGVRNFWKWRKIIWRDRWWDYAFLHDLIKFKIHDMQKNWSNSHYVGWEEDEKTLTELLEILEKIDQIQENGSSIKDDKEIDELYKQFGIKLFGIVKWEDEFNGKTFSKQCSQIRKFWD